MTHEKLNTWVIALVVVILLLSICSLMNERQEQADAEAYKRETIKQAQVEHKQRQHELRALAIESEYMTGVRMVSK